MGDTIFIKRSGQAPLRVRGELLSSQESSSNNASSDYSGSAGRSMECKIYKTAAGKYVVALHHNTCRQGEHDTDEAYVLPSLSECVAALGGHCPAWMLEDIIKDIGAENVAEEVS